MDKDPTTADENAQPQAATMVADSPEPVRAQPQVQAESVPAPKKKRTAGNITYDFGVFGSVAWVGVATLSALSAHEAQYGSNRLFGWLRTLNDKVSGGLARSLSNGILKNASPQTVEGYAKGTAMFLTLGMGGNALMPLIKWLEDNRHQNACRIDHLLGTTPPDPKTVAPEPPQSWKSVFSGRMFSWGMSYAAFVAMGPKLTGAISNWFGEKTAGAIMHVAPKANPLKVRRWTDIAAFDALFTVITCVLTYAFSRHVARKDYNKTGVEDELYTLNPIAPNPLDGEPQVDKPQKSFTRELQRPREQLQPSGGFIERLQNEQGFAPAR